MIEKVIYTMACSMQMELKIIIQNNSSEEIFDASVRRLRIFSKTFGMDAELG